MSPFAFISAVRDFFDAIVTIGGGITDGAGVAGAVAAGADLVYMGTRFLATEESMAPPEYKQMVVDHGCPARGNAQRNCNFHPRTSERAA